MSKKTGMILSVAALGAVVASQAAPITVVSKAVGDANYLNGGGQDRNEMILNNSGTNPSRFGVARYDADILGGAAGAPDFTNPAAYTLTSATMTLVEQSGRNGNNGTMSGIVGGFFMNTSGTADWTSAGIEADTQTWHGNSAARPGNLGGNAFTNGLSNVDDRSNGLATDRIEFTDGIALIAHTFDAGNDSEMVTIDLTAGGASLLEIQGILGDWVAGDNAGIGQYAEFGNQGFFQSMNIAAGGSVGSTIDGDATFSGVADATELGNGAGGSYLTLQFEAIPEPATLGLVGLFGGGLLFIRRRLSL